MSQLETGQTVEIFRDVNTAKLADVTGGASHVTKDQTIALWRNGGVNITVRDGVTDWSWRGIFQGAGHILPDCAVLVVADEIKVVLPTGENGTVQGFTIASGRISRFENDPLRSDPIRQAAIHARDVFVARQEAAAQSR
ncbi:MAG: hypothetical protein AAB532_00925 [Patescibacteria group bacterium]